VILAWRPDFYCANNVILFLSLSRGPTNLREERIWVKCGGDSDETLAQSSGEPRGHTMPELFELRVCFAKTEGSILTATIVRLAIAKST
jgi:hypothetical protein